MVLLTLLTILLVLALVAVLAVGVAKIMWALESIGNAPTSSPGSLLAKIRWGVRAIEQQTAAVGPQARRLNGALETIEVGLRQIHRTGAPPPGRGR